MFLIANIVGMICLFLECQFAWMAFSGLTNSCDALDPTFPCQISTLFNENFQAIPVVGQICVFYPMLNVAAVPVLNITLRNNLMSIVPIKRWIRNSGYKPLMFLLEVSFIVCFNA
jgi:hypothetical protein